MPCLLSMCCINNIAGACGLAVSRLGPVVRRSAGKRTDPGSTPASAHHSLHKLWFMDTVSRLCPAQVIRGLSDKKQKSLKTRGFRGIFFFKPTIKMVQSGTYLDTFQAWNSNCFFKVQTEYYLHDSGVLEAQSVFPWRWVLPWTCF